MFLHFAVRIIREHLSTDPSKANNQLHLSQNLKFFNEFRANIGKNYKKKITVVWKTYTTVDLIRGEEGR